MKSGGKETYLKGLLGLVGVSQADLARELKTSPQQVNKWASEGRKITRDWAKRMEPVLGVSWPYLVDGRIPPELQPGDEDSKLIHKQLLLVKEGWPFLSIDERRAIIATIGALTEPRRKSA